MYYYTTYKSPIGKLTIASDEESVIGLWIQNQKYFCSTISNLEIAIKKDQLPILQNAIDWLDKYFNGEMPQISEIKLNPKGSEFRKLVWSKLCEIPYGQVTTYGNIAKEIAILKGISSMSAQAVGGAIRT